MASTARRMFFFGVRNSRKATDLSGCKQKKLARPVRFELTTPCSGGMYSIHLSYGRAVSAPPTRVTERAMSRDNEKSFDWSILTRLIPLRQFVLLVLRRGSEGVACLTHCARSNFFG